MEEKSKLFCIIKFSDTVRYMYPEVSGLTYWINKESGEEYVRVFLYNTKDFDICVSADSLPAMITDVIKGIERRFN